MKTDSFLVVLLSIALVILCADLYAERRRRARLLEERAASGCEYRPSPAGNVEGAANAPVPETGKIAVDSTDLVPGVSGFGGPVPVLVEVENGVVARVAPKLPNDETPAFFGRLETAGLWKAWDGLPVEVAVTARVDAVTSATFSSDAAIANARAAFAEAAKRNRKE